MLIEDVIERETFTREEESAAQEQDVASEEKIEEEVKEPLPPLPGTPE